MRVWVVYCTRIFCVLPVVHSGGVGGVRIRLGCEFLVSKAAKFLHEGFRLIQHHILRYDAGPGDPLARALGSGWVLELLSRLTHTPITSTSSPVPSSQLFAVNTTLTSNPTTFPLNNTIYSDATHEVVMMYIYTALNLTVLAEDGTPNLTKMKRSSKRKWVTSRFAPFGSNMQVQRE